ncbi:hypothetical protein [Streptomyces decoyicus]|uniref:hypothetical protein n=1 Tax=Streptomyces decoyicus TaxID=249567 RepID=UPI001FD7FBBC|nr:hypothetical protein [Streptomyces decoyicus]
MVLTALARSPVISYQPPIQDDWSADARVRISQGCQREPLPATKYAVNAENRSAVPMPQSEQPAILAGLEIAMKWGQVLGGPEQLKIALDAIEPQLIRDHEARVQQLSMQEKADEQRVRAARERQQLQFRTTSLIVGAVLSVAMLAAGVYVAQDAWWLASLLCGPSLISMAAITVLRRYDKAMKAVADAAKRATSAASRTPIP